jgi:beta-lactamase class A
MKPYNTVKPARPSPSKRYALIAVVGLGIVSAVSMPFILKARHKPAPMAVIPPSPINPDDWKSLVNALNKRARQYSGSVGYVIKDLRTGDVAMSHAQNIFLSASLIKLPILCASYQAVQEGKLALSTPITLQKADIHGGSGVLKRAAIGTVYTNRELLELMIVHSDNTAAALLIKQLGFDYLQQTFTHLGLLDTEIHPDGFNLSARRVVSDNRTSPRDMGYLLEKIYRRELVSPEASDDMLLILKHQKLRDRLPKYLPLGWQIAHKTGLLRKSCHDVGIVFSPKGDYMICVLTGEDSNYRAAKHFIASVGRITFDYYQGGFHRPIYQSRRRDPSANAVS